MLPRNEYRISIISNCNMKCVYCHNEGNVRYSKLSKEQIRTIIENSSGLGLKKIRLTGGEPLIHPDIFGICKMIKEKYNLDVEINTNCIEINKLILMIKKGWIKRVVVGLDYFDEKISKQSPIGVSSKIILNNIKRIKKLGCNVSISVVYNGDYKNIYNIVNWCVKNKIRVKIIEEIKNEIEENSSFEYLKMRERIIEDFNFEIKIDNLEEVNCYLEGLNIVSFFPSLCRLRRCDLCKKIHLRITSEGKIKQCIHYCDDDMNILGSDGRKNIVAEIKRDINYHRHFKD